MGKSAHMLADLEESCVLSNDSVSNRRCQSDSLSMLLKQTRKFDLPIATAART